MAAFIRACCSSRASRLFSSASAVTRLASSPGPGGQRRGRAIELVPIPPVRFQRLEAADRLEPAHARRHAALRDDREQADVAGGADVRAAAQLDAEARHRHHADALAVLLAEQRHGSAGDRLLRLFHVGLHWCVSQHLLVDDLFDRENLLACQRREVNEIESQTIGSHERPRLLDVTAQHLPQAPRAAGEWLCDAAGWRRECRRRLQRSRSRAP